MKIAVSLHQYLTESARLLELAAQSWSEQLVAGAISTMVSALGEGKPLLACGNGGSACDAMHLTGELVGRFLMERRPVQRGLTCACIGMKAIKDAGRWTACSEIAPRYLNVTSMERKLLCTP